MREAYYRDEDKITYDEADELVEGYVAKYRRQKQRTTSKAVAEAVGVEPSQHNLVRIYDALDRRLEIARPCDTRATQFRLP